MTTARTPAPTRAVKVRHPTRGSYDRATVEAVLRATPFVHVGFVDERPIVLPMLHAVVDDHVVLHGLRTSRMMKLLATGIDVCVTATILDGLVLARSATHSSANYRSVVVLGRTQPLAEPAELRRVLDELTDQLLPGRRPSLRPPTDADVATTAMVRVPLTEASVKIRTGGPLDGDEDGNLPVWAGEVPFTTVAGEPVPSSDLEPGIAVPEHVRAMVGRPHGG